MLYLNSQLLYICRAQPVLTAGIQDAGHNRLPMQGRSELNATIILRRIEMMILHLQNPLTGIVGCHPQR